MKFYRQSRNSNWFCTKMLASIFFVDLAWLEFVFVYDYLAGCGPILCWICVRKWCEALLCIHFNRKRRRSGIALDLERELFLGWRGLSARPCRCRGCCWMRVGDFEIWVCLFLTNVPMLLRWRVQTCDGSPVTPQRILKFLACWFVQRFCKLLRTIQFWKENLKINKK